MQRLIDEDAIGQLRRRDGLMAELGSENGEVKLDWVEGVARLLADPRGLETVEAEARAIWERGIRHVIWAGMGGSVMAVRVLTGLGFCSPTTRENTAHIIIHPLDSTDPAALNAILRAIAAAKGLSLPPATERVDRSLLPSLLPALLADVLMVGVSMGMTSEEPITHLAWFSTLLEQAGLPLPQHLLVMTLPGSYLDRFARERQVPSRPLQLDGETGTGGRMSAPSTRVFLLPAAFALLGSTPAPGRLRAMLREAWDLYNLALAATQPAQHPFVRLASAMSGNSKDGACRLLLRLPGDWHALFPWIEQLMEESLGKGGKGVVVFDYSSRAFPPVHSESDGNAAEGLLRVLVANLAGQAAPRQESGPSFTLVQSQLDNREPHHRLAALASSFLGWQLSMALFGYLQRIPFAGQPAVENYKARARDLRMLPDPLQTIQHWSWQLTNGQLTLFAPEQAGHDINAGKGIAALYARTLSAAYTHGRLRYLDITVNGEASPAFFSMLEQGLRKIADHFSGIPIKIRRAPAAYHSTEQSEMDGPLSLVSLRLLARRHEPCIIGDYSDTFLCAQAISTWQAMLEQGRPCFLLVVDGYLADGSEPLERFFEGVEGFLL